MVGFSLDFKEILNKVIMNVWEVNFLVQQIIVKIFLHNDDAEPLIALKIETKPTWLLD